MKTKVWYPYQQMQNQNAFPMLESAKGVKLKLEDGRELIDGISSWWCTIHGYSHEELNQTIEAQIKKVSHFMLGGITNKPAENLAKKLIEITPKGLEHIFLSDSGSVGIEVALKMAIQYHHNKGQDKRHIISLKKAYHGDTFKAMEVGDDPCYHGAFNQLFENRSYILPPYCNDIDRAINDLQEIISSKSDIAAFIVEPLLQGAGGFRLYPAEFLNRAYKICQQHDILMIFDEVATGFGRTGTLFAANQCDFTPDIMVLSKALTAGYVGHAATIATSAVFEAFYGKTESNALMHGPTFSGNPLACSVALKSIEIFERENYLEKIKRIHAILLHRFSSISSEKIKDIRIIGACAAIEVHDSAYLEGFKEFAIENGTWLRPFEEFVYIMPAYIISEAELNKLIDVISKWFTN